MKKKNKNPRKRIVDTDLNPPNDDSDSYYQGKIRSFDLRKIQAIEMLNGTHMPTNFKFRDQEIERINSFLDSCIKGEKKGLKFLMVTGSPGSGKTLSANSILSKRQCDIIKMNANMIKKVSQVQQQISLKLLEDEIQRTALQIVRQLQQNQYSKICIVYIEQIQILFKSAPDIISEDFLMLFSRKNINLILIGISNTIDTLQKYCNKFAFKVQDIQNVVFTPYTSQHIAQILKDKLSMIKSKTDIQIEFPDKLMKFSAQKLQGLRKGDFRICLQFLKQLLKLTFAQLKEEEEPQTLLIDIGSINTIFNKMNISKDVLIASLPYQQQILLIAIFTITKRTQALCITMKELQPELQWICNSLQINYTNNMMENGLKELEQYSLIQLKKKDSQTKVILKISLNDIQCTYSDHFIFKKFFTPT